MFEYFRGKLVHAHPTKAILDVGGVGYAIQISLKTYQSLPQLHSELFLYVAPVIREDEHTLYGFLTLDEKNLFHSLTSISSIGPKTAVTILGHVDIADFQLAVLQANSALLSKIPGIGKKTAERIIMELKDKFHAVSQGAKHALSSTNPTISDAISALVNLGYHPLDAQKRVSAARALHAEEPSLPVLISSALKH